jgi:hypothetical protein
MFNNELNVSVRWHPRQVVWKDIGVLTDYRNIFYLNVCDSISARIQIFLLGQIEGSSSMIW